MIEETAPFHLIRVSLFGDFRVERRLPVGTWEIVANEAWGGHTYSRSLLKWFLCTSGRRALRGTIIDALWPEMKSAEPVLTNAVSNLRQVLGDHELLRSFGSHQSTGYELANQSLIWVDSDATHTLLIEAENIGNTSLQALPLLEEAFRLFNRGDFLEGDGGLWCYPKRTHHEKAKKRCLLWLAESYEIQQKIWQARTHYCHLLDADPLDEDILCRFLAFLHRNGMTKDAPDYWQEAQTRFKQQGFSLSSTTRQLASRLEEERPSLEKSSSSLKYSPSLSLIDQFTYALVKPSSTHWSTIAYLEARVDGYWRDRHSARLSSIDLLSFVIDDFQKIIHLLHGSLLPTIRMSVCSIGSSLAQLIGHLLFDIGDLQNAERFQYTAIQAAREAQDPVLEAIAHARASYVFNAFAEDAKAVLSTQKALSLACRSENQTIKAYLGVRDAHTQAIVGKKRESLESLDMAALATQRSEQQHYSKAENYWLHFNQSRLLEYQGSCFQKLYRPDAQETHNFLTQAMEVLQQALAQLSPTLLQRRPSLLLKISSIYLLQNNVEGACEHALQAITILSQTQSQASLQQLFVLRRNLERWGHMPSIKELDHQIALLPMKERQG